MAYTPTNNPYIPGDPYSYDLKWLVSKIKEHSTTLANLDTTIQTMIQEYLDQHDPIYFETAADLINSDTKSGSLAFIMGFNTVSDEGENLYLITDDYNQVLNSDFYLTMSGANKWAIPIIISAYVTPQMFGATADGLTDDTQAILTAYKYVESMLKELYFPAGTYIFNDTIKPTIDGISIRGAGPNLVTMNCSASFIKTGKDISSATIHRASISGIGFVSTSNNIIIIDFGGFNYSQISNCYVVGTGSPNGDIGIACYGTGINGYYNLFEKIDVGSCETGYHFDILTITGITVRTPNADLVIGGRIFSCNVGYLDTGSGNKLIGSTLESNVTDIQVGYGASSDADKRGGNPCIYPAQ